MKNTSSSQSRAIERVMGDRQRHEEQIASISQGSYAQYKAGEAHPKVRIYVSSQNGHCQLKDDRESLTESEQELIEVIKAEYISSDLDPDMVGEEVLCHSECKGEMLYLLSKDNQKRAKVDYVAFIDDDVEVKATDILKAVKQASKRGIKIFQLQLSSDSHAVWTIFKEVRGPEEWSDIDFVEIMAPVISQNEIDLGLLDVLEPFKSGFGWDFYLLPVLSELFQDFRPGIYHGASMAHKRPIATSNKTVFSNGLSALEEEEILRSALVLVLSEQENTTDRGRFLVSLKKILHKRMDALQGLAAALHSLSERHWKSRKLESQCHEMTSMLEDSRMKIETLRNEKEVILEQICDLTEERDRLSREVTAYAEYVREVYGCATWKIGRLCIAPFTYAKKLMRELQHVRESD